MEYICKKCNKQFTRLYNYDRHINRKISCDKVLIYECKNCNKLFANKVKYNRHMNRKYPCKSIDFKYLELENENLKLKNENLKLTNENLKLTMKGSSIAIGNNNSTGNHIENQTINNTINQTNNVTVNAYGCENIAHILKTINADLICQGSDSEVFLFEQIHFNDKYPENKNIKICDLSRDKIGVLVVKNGKQSWGVISSDELTRNHQEKVYKIFQGDMIERGKECVSQSEIDNLIELATPSSKHRETTKKGLIGIMQKHKQ